ncbi:hypothetical protein BC831DRAFT_462904 [Entophlyctis helioformis]|nr:hypothetical protein BC831DRAFT_462904 [Entophlyctis helioformis]
MLAREGQRSTLLIRLVARLPRWCRLLETKTARKMSMAVLPAFLTYIAIHPMPSSAKNGWPTRVASISSMPVECASSLDMCEAIPVCGANEDRGEHRDAGHQQFERTNHGRVRQCAPATATCTRRPNNGLAQQQPCRVNRSAQIDTRHCKHSQRPQVDDRIQQASSGEP